MRIPWQARVLVILAGLSGPLQGAIPEGVAPGVACGPRPAWVEPVGFAVAPPGPRRALEEPARVLLVDLQTSVADRPEQQYRHVAKQVFTEQGVQRESQISVDFDPTYESLVFHEVIVHRGGAHLDRLDPDALQVFQRQPDREAQIYDGAENATLFVEDVRRGDVIEYSYTVYGFNPVFGGRYCAQVGTQFDLPMDHFRFRYRTRTGRLLLSRDHGSGLQPRQRTRGAVTEYLWSARDVPALVPDDTLPLWLDPYPAFQLTEFSSWEEVAAWGAELFAVPDAVPESLAAVLQDLQRIPGREGQALAALRFVQDEVRYLGIEIGRGSHEPRPPEQVLRQRFGDCKDKARLLVTLLRGLGVQADAALVNSFLGDRVHGWAPSPLAFNHAIVRLELEGQVFWVDPTIASQGGTLRTLWLPPYGAALVLKPAGTVYQSVPGCGRRSPCVEAYRSFELGMPGDPTHLTVETVLRDDWADWTRAYLHSVSRKEYERQLLNSVLHYYPLAQASSTVAIEDDREENHLRIVESYEILDSWEHGGAPGTLQACFQAPEIVEALADSPSKQRTMPLWLPHPLHIVCDTDVTLPVAADLQPWSRRVENLQVLFTAQVVPHGRHLYLGYEYQTLADHVPAAECPRYFQELETIQRSLQYSLSTDDPGSGPRETASAR